MRRRIKELEKRIGGARPALQHSSRGWWLRRKKVKTLWKSELQGGSRGRAAKQNLAGFYSAVAMETKEGAKTGRKSASRSAKYELIYFSASPSMKRGCWNVTKPETALKGRRRRL